MNQRGDVTVLFTMLVAILLGILLLAALQLQQSFSFLQNRTRLFLCTKEIKGEMGRYLVFMGRSNWAIVNSQRASIILALIPGLQGAASDAQNLKKYLIQMQNTTLFAYLHKLRTLQQKGCPLDPRLLLTPFHLNYAGYERGVEDQAKLRSKEWTYTFLKRPYFLTLEVQARSFQSIQPDIVFKARERGAKSLSL